MDENLQKINDRKDVDVALIVISLGILVAFVVFMVGWPETGLTAVQGIFDFLIAIFGSFLEVFVLGVFIASLYLAFSKYGRIKLGDGDPEYSTFTYIAMMTLAALAAACLYWSFTEWAYYYEAPGIGLEPRSVAAMEASLGYQFFHWGLSMNAVFSIIAIPIAYGFYVRKVPSIQTSAICLAMIPEKTKGRALIGKFIDFCVIFGIVGGLGCTLGLAVPLSGGALTKCFGIEVTFAVKVGIVLVIGLVFTFTSFLGTKKGMARLSNMTYVLAIGMILFVFIMGPSTFILRNTVNSMGWMFNNFVKMSLFTDPVADTKFPEYWTMYFAAFYLNYAAMMGIFIAKISKGRTIRSIILSSMCGITIGGWMLFAVNGSFSIHSHLTGVFDVVEIVNSGVGEVAIYEILTHLKGGVILPYVMILMIVGFVASSLDSASLSLSQTVTRSGDVTKKMRIFWCVVLTMVPLTIMFIGAKFTMLKIFSIVVSIPFMFIIVGMVVGLMKWFKEDAESGLLKTLMVKTPLDE